MKLLFLITLFTLVGCSSINKGNTIYVKCSEYNNGPVKGFFMGKDKIIITEGSCRLADEKATASKI